MSNKECAHSKKRTQEDWYRRQGHRNVTQDMFLQQTDNAPPRTQAGSCTGSLY